MSSGRTYGDQTTHRRILDATRELVEERGGALRLADVAERAGVSRQAVYLHFEGRSGLLVALVRDMDESLDLAGSIDEVMTAPHAAELLDRLVLLNATFWSAVHPVAQVLEVGRHTDDALRAAWDDRMQQRRALFGAVIERLAESTELATDWTVADAAGVLYATLHYDGWRELTHRLGWSEERYVGSITTQLRRSLLA